MGKKDSEEDLFKTRIDWDNVEDDEDDDDFIGGPGDDKQMQAKINREHKRRLQKYKVTGEWDEGDV